MLTTLQSQAHLAQSIGTICIDGEDVNARD